jgi:hypothetical protein
MGTIEATAAGEVIPDVSVFQEELEAGVRVSWLNERQILVFSLPNSSRHAVQVLFDRAIEILNAWPAERPCSVVLDFTAGNIAATPYSRQRGKEMTSLRPELTLIVAFVVPRSIQAQVFQFVTRSMKRHNTQMAVFFVREDALSWVRKMADPG